MSEQTQRVEERRPSTSIDFIKAQRDRLSVAYHDLQAAYHDLQADYAMTSSALADISRQLAAAQARIVEMGQAERDDDGA